MKTKQLGSSFAIIFAMIFMAFALPAQAAGYGSSSGSDGWEFNVAGMYLYNDTKNGNNDTTDNRGVVDVGLGYHFNMLYVGGIYAYDDQQIYQAGPGGSFTQNTYRSYGATLGIESDNVYLNVSYFIGSTASIGANEYSNGSGYQASLGYMFPISSFSIGPQLDFRSTHYTSVNPGGNADYTFTTFLPYIALKFRL